MLNKRSVQLIVDACGERLADAFHAGKLVDTGG
jgi:hypothetical protein